MTGDSVDKCMRTVTIAATAALGLGVLSGCGSNGSPDTSADTSGSVSTSRPVLGSRGYGPVHLGMSLTAAKRTGTIKVTRKPDSGTPCTTFRLRADHDVTGFISPAHGVVAIFPGDRASTPDGIHVGSSRAATRKAYPQLRKEVNGWYARLSPQGAQPEVDYRFTFKHGTGPVDAMFLQRSDQDCYE